jgi:hypothetical protein
MVAGGLTPGFFSGSPALVAENPGIGKWLLFR